MLYNEHSGKWARGRFCCVSRAAVTSVENDRYAGNYGRSITRARADGEGVSAALTAAQATQLVFQIIKKHRAGSALGQTGMIDHRPVRAPDADHFDDMPAPQILQPEGVTRDQLFHRRRRRTGLANGTAAAARRAGERRCLSRSPEYFNKEIFLFLGADFIGRRFGFMIGARYSRERR
jgi:hypothetical protein